MLEAEFWVAIAFALFVGVLAYYGVHKLLLRMLDERRERIRGELDEARRLKEEAQALLAETKIAQADAQALADVRAAAADAAVAAAEQILSRTVKDNLAENLLAESIAALKSKLN
jgi:F-type H+-transporting ATPase subunit b